MKFLLLFFLTGCINGSVTSRQIEVAKEKCKNNRGIRHIKPDNSGIIVTCENDAKFEIDYGVFTVR